MYRIDSNLGWRKIESTNLLIENYILSFSIKMTDKQSIATEFFKAFPTLAEEIYEHLGKLSGAQLIEEGLLDCLVAVTKLHNSSPATKIEERFLKQDTWNWLKETGCKADKDGAYTFEYAPADGKKSESYKFAPANARQEIMKYIQSGDFETDCWGWKKEDNLYQNGNHDPNLPHLQKLFTLADKHNCSLTLDIILKEMGDERHRDAYGNKCYTERTNTKYWKDAIRELHKQRLVIRL
jgi:hypothetical protein